VGDGWRIEERNGLTHELGIDRAARVADPDHPDRIIEWLLERSTDTSGNSIEYQYRVDQGIAYIAIIHYGIYALRFVYEGRADVRHDGRAGFSRRRMLLCKRIELLLDPGPEEPILRTYQFVYASARGSEVSLLEEIRLTAHGAAPDGSEDVRRPAIRFQYTEFDPRQYHLRWMSSEDGPPPGLDDPDAALVTLDNAPLPGVLINRGGREYYWPNRGNGSWGQPRPLRKAPFAGSFRRNGIAFVDMNGSGTADLMISEPGHLQGYYENGGSEGWNNFVAFPRGRRAAPPLADRRLVLSDTDNDGVIDAIATRKHAFLQWHNDGSQGWSAPALVPKGSADLLDIDFSDPDVYLADMTGDGSSDIVRAQSGRIEFWPSLGRGRFGERVVMKNSPRLRRKPIRDSLVFVDLDGDGCDDLIEISPAGLTIYQNQNGEGFAEPVLIPAIPAPLPGTVRAMNLSGRASAGLVWNSTSGLKTRYIQFEFAGPQPPYLLTRIDNGAGLQSEIFYRSAVEDYERDRHQDNRWATNFPFPYLVVARTHEADLVSGRTTAVELAYHEAHFEPRTRQFQGFRRTDRVERGDSSRPDTLLIHHFLMAQERQPGNGPEHAALNGMLSRVETYQLDGTPKQLRPYRVETSEHALSVLDRSVDGRTRSFVFVTAYRVEDTERTDDSRVEVKTYTYDANGNLIREVNRGSGVKEGGVQPTRERTTEVTYAVSSSRYLLDKPARVVVRDQDGSLLSEKRFFYDGPDFEGLPLGQAKRGLLTREQEWTLTQADFDNHYAGMNQAGLGFISDDNADGVPSVFVSTRRQLYDGRGLLVASRDALGNDTRFGYDASGLFRVELGDMLGETRFDYDRATGQVIRITYANGLITQFAYDAQGRLLKSAVPGEDFANPNVAYAYDETSIPNKRITRFRQSGAITSVGLTYFDGAGAEFQQRVEVSSGRYLVSALKQSNPWGDLAVEFEPTFSANPEFGLPDTGGRPSRRFFYDARGRIVRTVNFNGGISTAEFEPFRVVLRDANDNDNSPDNIARGQFDTPREEQFDVLRYLVRVVDHLGANQSVVTSYEVGPSGELKSVSDARGVKFRYGYDRRGARLSITLRESGERKVWYDALKQPVRTLDPAGHELSAIWDSLGRQTRLLHGATPIEKYEYDTPAQNAFGRLAQVRYAGGRQVFTYDGAGRLRERAYFYDGEAAPHRLRFECDALGREIAVTHTDGTRIERRLTFNGWVQTIPGVLQSVEYDPRGYPTEILYENGVRTRYLYTAGPGRIRKQTTTSPANQVLEDVDFTFDLMDMLLSRNDAAPGGSGLRQYAYDPLYQLTRFSGSDNATPFQRTYDYSPDYNLQNFEEARATLHYDDPLHPDRVSGLTPDGGVLFAATYDGNGNLLNLPEQQFTYNEKNELTHFTRTDGLTAAYQYDHLGFRVSKTLTDSGGNITRVLFVSDRAEIQNGTPAYFVAVGPLRIAVLTGGTVRFLHDNGLGSTGFVTDAAGARIGTIDNQPFGNAEAGGDTEFRTFSLHPVDAESGLVYMRRRYYHPRLGRFLTPDLMCIYQPEAFLHAPQGFHLYTFVANDPLNKTDPSGLSFWSFVGAVVGVGLGVIAAAAFVAALALTGGAAGVLLALTGVVAATGVSYLITSLAKPDAAFGQFMRGFMIGFNAGMNGFLASAIFGPTVGGALGVINFLATFEGVAKDSTYQGILGWSSWLMPMSWAATGLGLAVFTINLAVAGITFQQWKQVKIDEIAIEWKTGSIVMVGGLIQNKSAFNMGNFVYIDRGYVNNSSPEQSYDALVRHETGHTLSVASFGSLFHLYDFVGENIVGAGKKDYGEKLAESHSNRPGDPRLPMWS
jgi:RHS repeat-associated protein